MECSFLLKVNCVYLVFKRDKRRDKILGGVIQHSFNLAD